MIKWNIIITFLHWSVSGFKIHKCYILKLSKLSFPGWCNGWILFYFPHLNVSTQALMCISCYDYLQLMLPLMLSFKLIITNAVSQQFWRIQIYWMSLLKIDERISNTASITGMFIIIRQLSITKKTCAKCQGSARNGT